MSSDLFAAFGEVGQSSPATLSSQTCGNVIPGRPTPTPLSMDTLLTSVPAADGEDDDFGDFEDASKPADGPSQAELDILKARMGSPIEINRPEYFEGASNFRGFSNASISHSRNTSRQGASHIGTSSHAKPAASLQSESNITFRSRTGSPPKQDARPDHGSLKPVSSPRKSKSNSVSKVPSRPQPKSNLPFTPKSNLPFTPRPKPAFGGIEVGAHPFANHMDLLFAGGDDEYDAGADDLNVDLANDPEAAMAYSKKLIAAQMAEQERQKPQASPPVKPASQEAPKSPNKLRKKSQYAPPVDADILFDVENVSDDAAAAEDDDWGDFETSAVAQPKVSIASFDQKEGALKQNASHQTITVDLLGMDGGFGGTSDTWSNAWSSEPQKPESKHAPSQPIPIQDDPWDDFEDSVPPATRLSIIPSTIPTSTLDLTARPHIAQSEPQLPPTTIPPPAILLSLFPSLLSYGDSNLFSTLPKLSQSQRQELLSQPATHKFLQNHIALATVLAHIIAGRKLRWKRDQFLAASMRVGPAGKGGMKLAGVDKGEAAREEREVNDTLRLWRAQVGKLRSAISGANSSSSFTKLPAAPEISEQMPVKLWKPAEGGISAPAACGLCGLKREERVKGADEGVEDSFGEWWVSGMNMHVSCWNFWGEYEAKLRGR